MKNFLKRLPKKVFAAVATMALVAGVASQALAGFGPANRPTMTWNGDNTPGANHVVFNSFVNNPVWGDERDFVRAGVEQRDSSRTDPVTNVQDGDIVNVVMFVHNNADPSLNASGQGIARDTTVRATIPGATAQSQDITGYISASNAQPREIWDTVTINSSSVYSMDYIPGSVRVSGGLGNGAYDKALPNADITKGFKIGEDLDGDMSGCFQYIQYVTFKVKIQVPNFTLEKKVRLEGQTSSDWKDEVTAKPGQTVEYKIEFLNKGKTTLENVAVRDTLPKHVSLVSGSTMIYNGNFPNGVNAGSDSVTSAGGIDVGSYSTGSNGIVFFKAKIAGTDKLDCGTNKLVNTGYMRPGKDNTRWYYDIATVKVDGKKCEEPEKPKYVCESLTVEKIGGRKIRTTVKAPASGGAKFKNVSVNFGDGTQPKVTDQLVNEYEYKTDGTFKVSAAVTFTVAGTDKTVSGDACTAMVTFEGEKTPPTELPKTGAGSLIGLFTIVTLAAAAAHNVISRRVA